LVAELWAALAGTRRGIAAGHAPTEGGVIRIIRVPVAMLLLRGLPEKSWERRRYRKLDAARHPYWLGKKAPTSHRCRSCAASRIRCAWSTATKEEGGLAGPLYRLGRW